ncbi:MAG TPA: hypothetical protein PKB10_05015 [Tepidisphaeraceae bacterium]|nr:hypothetical protein [Tepidisphaeraceae bacterium]
MGLSHWDLWIAFIGLVGMLLAIAARFTFARNRPTSDHPACRKCGHDLFGLPTTSTRCPECGTDLTIARAILPHTQTVPTKRRWIVRTILLIALILTLWAGWSVIHNPAYTSYKPSLVLVYLTEVTPPSDYVAPAELMKRLEAGDLDRLSVWLIRQRAVAWVQATERAPITAGVRWWFIMALHVEGKLDDTELIRRVDELTTTKFAPLGRDDQVLGTSLAIQCRILSMRGQATPYEYTMIVTPQFSRINGERVPLSWDRKLFTGGGPSILFSHEPIPLGQHELVVAIDVFISTPNGRLLPIRTNHTLSTTITIPDPATTQPAPSP